LRPSAGIKKNRPSGKRRTGERAALSEKREGSITVDDNQKSVHHPK